MRISLAPLALTLAISTAAAQSPTINDAHIGDVPTDGGGVLQLYTDLYLPGGATEPTPLVLYIHGGSWLTGDHNEVPSIVLELLDSGIAVATVGYRPCSEAIFPAQIHDVKGAVRYIRSKADQLNVDPDRIAAWGLSSGGQLAALLATSGGIAELEGTSGFNLSYSSRVCAIVDFYGLTDMLNISLDVVSPPGSIVDYDAPTTATARLIGFDGPTEGMGVLRANQLNPLAPYPEKLALITLANPITHLTPDDPPMFITHGVQDVLVPFHQSQRLFDAAIAIGSAPIFKAHASQGHGSLSTATYAQARAFLIENLFGTGPAAGSAYCFGDGSSTACPCGNASTVEAKAGCLNSSDTGGSLRASGTASIGADTLVLSGDGMPPSFMLYFAGAQMNAEGMGMPFGDGLLCVSGTVYRLGVKLNVNGGSFYPDVGDAPIGVQGLNVAGTTRYFQGYYRDAAVFCTSGTFNTTNAYAVTFKP